MSNVVDFAASVKRIKDLRVLNAFLDEGLNSTDMAIIALAASRAFTKNTEIPSLEEVAALGTTALRYLTCKIFEDETGTVYQFSGKDQVVLQYIITHQPLTFDWHEATAVKYPLLDVEDPGKYVAFKLSDHLVSNGLEEISLSGFFAIDAFYFACNSPMSALHLQILPGRNSAGLLLYDSEREVEIVVMAEMDAWQASATDLAVDKTPA